MGLICVMVVVCYYMCCLVWWFCLFGFGLWIGFKVVVLFCFGFGGLLFVFGSCVLRFCLYWWCFYGFVWVCVLWVWLGVGFSVELGGGFI